MARSTDLLHSLRRAVCRGLFVATILGTLSAGAPAQSERPGPVEAEQTLDQFVLHPDCRIELVAAEPDVIDPVAIQFGPDGKLWVVEYSDYPNGPPEDGPPLSRIRTLTDADGDGRYTDPVTFADKLLFANGLMLWQDGVIVTTDGTVTFLRDNDGDGRADETQEWFRGFARKNPQLRANHPTLGLDGHIYVASGIRGGDVIATRENWAADPLSPQPSPSGGEGATQPKPVSLSGRDFRFDPFTGKYESVSGPGQFGLCFDPFGNRFNCDNRSPCRHMVLEDRYIARNPFLAVSQVFEDVSPKAENSHLYPISRTWTTSNLHANQFTAACGVLIYGGDGLSQFRGNSFTCEPTANLVHRDVLEPKGATFTSHYGREGVEFLATKDEWFRPVNLKHGPDGALYVVDMYRAVIEHPQFMPDELKTRPDLTLGNDRGRIYRIVPKKRETLHGSFRTDSEALVEYLTSRNAWHRETAFRLLLEQRHPQSGDQQKLEGVHPNPNKPLDKAIGDLVGSDASSETQYAAASLLAAVGILPDLSPSLDDPRLLELQVRLLEAVKSDAPEMGQSVVERFLHNPATDDHLTFQVALSLGAFARSDELIAALTEIAFDHADDHWFRDAVGSSSSEIEDKVLVGVLRRWRSSLEDGESDAAAPPLALVSQFARMVGNRGNAEGAVDVLRLVTTPLADSTREAAEAWERTQFAALTSLNDGLARGRSSLAEVRATLAEDEQARLDEVFEEAEDLAGDKTAEVGLRNEAIAVLALDPSQVATDVLIDLASSETNQSVLVAAIDALAGKSDERVPEVLLDGFKGRTPAVRAAVLSTLLARGDRIHRLLDEVEAGNLSPRDVNPQSTARLTKSGDAKIKTRAAKLLASTVDADRAKVITAYTPCLEMTGDPERGRALFAKTCATCHKMGALGTNVGPDVSDSRTKTPEFLLTNILDPNRAVDGNYFGYTIVDTQGRVHTGIITAETASSVTIRLPEGKDVTLLRQDVDEMANTGLSLMPVGLEKDITPEQMADLISYIKNWRYLDGSVPEEVIGR